MNVLVSLIVAASLLLGGGATLAAAQDDLPNQTLYQLKLWAENASLAMNGDPQEQADLLMEMAQTRVQEMAALAEQGVTPPDQVRERLQQHLDQALNLAATLDEPTRDQILLRLRDRLQTQDQIMEKLQLHVDTDMEPLFTQTRQMLQSHLRLVDDGLADPQGFRYMMQNQNQYGQGEEVAPEPNQQGEPGFHQNITDEQPAVDPGAGTQNDYGPGNEPAGNQNQEQNQEKNGGGGSGNQVPGGPNMDSSGSGSGSGGGGGNK